MCRLASTKHQLMLNHEVKYLNTQVLQTNIHRQMSVNVNTFLKLQASQIKNAHTDFVLNSKHKFSTPIVVSHMCLHKDNQTIPVTAHPAS